MSGGLLKKYATVLMIFSLIVFVVLVNKYHQKALNYSFIRSIDASRSIKSSGCEEFLVELNMQVPSVLIDARKLNDMKNGNCTLSRNDPISIGVDAQYEGIQNPYLRVVSFTNDSETDYLELHTSQPQLIPQFFKHRLIGQLQVPTDVPKFEGFLKRSRHILCSNRTMDRNMTESGSSVQDSADGLALLRDELLDFGIFSFLNGGTLLGWYRECSVIPHTTDMDLAVFAWDFNPDYTNFVHHNSTKFKLLRKFGMLNDSFELTVVPKTVDGLRIDIFLMYNTTEDGKDMTYVGGVDPDGSKFKFIYPVYDPWCATDLLGHIFWLTCNPEQNLAKEYGKEWYLDHPSSRYNWKGRSKKNGKWTHEQMKTVYNIY